MVFGEDSGLVDTILRKAKYRENVLLKRGHVGDCRVKVKHGPFRLFTSRYLVDLQTYEFIKSRLRSQSVFQ